MTGHKNYTCCTIANGGNTVYLGTAFGSFIKASIDDKTFALSNVQQIIELESPIRTIARLSSGELLVATELGRVACYDLSTGKTRVISPGGRDAQAKIWRTLVLDADHFITCGNFRKIQLWTRNAANRFDPTIVDSGGHAVFCLNWLDEAQGSVFINDWNGSTEVWQYDGRGTVKLDTRARLYGNLQKVLTRQDGYIVATDYFGQVVILKSENHRIHIVQEFQVNEGQGRDVYYSKKLDSFVICTTACSYIMSRDFTEIYKVDQAANQALEFNGSILLLRDHGFEELQAASASKITGLDEYEFIKVGLVGASSTGKTTFCLSLLNKVPPDPREVPSSFGSRVIDIPVSSQDEETKRLLKMFDLAGQDEELFTYFPKIQDADMILLFFKGTDPGTLDKAISYYKQLMSSNIRAKYFLVQSFADQAPRFSEKRLQDLQKKYALTALPEILKFDISKEDHLKDLVTRLEGQIPWDRARCVKRTKISDLVRKALDIYYQRKEISILVNSLRNFVNYDLNAIRKVVEFLDYNGEVVYIPEADEVILNSEAFSRLQSDIPRIIDENCGFLRRVDIITSCRGYRVEHVNHILDYYNKHDIAIMFEEGDPDQTIVVVPDKLSTELLPTELTAIFSTDLLELVYNNSHEIKIKEILSFLSGLGFSLKSCTQKEVILYNPETAVQLYVSINLVKAAGVVPQRCAILARDKVSHHEEGAWNAIRDRLKVLIGSNIVETIDRTDHDVLERIGAELEGFELKLRAFIKKVIVKQFGKDWWKQVEPNTALVELKNRVQANFNINSQKASQKKDPKSLDLFDYLEFSQYLTLITELWERDSGKPIFKQYFDKKEYVVEHLTYLNDHRNADGHRREVVDKDVIDKLRVYIKDFSKHFTA